MMMVLMVMFEYLVVMVVVVMVVMVEVTEHGDDVGIPEDETCGGGGGETGL